MNIFITGGSGFVGRHLVSGLLDSHEVHCLHRASTRLTDFPSHVQLFQDHGDIISLSRYFKEKKIDAVVHLATYYVRDHEASDISLLVDANISLGLRILEALKDLPHVLFVNTGSSWQHYRNKPYFPVNLYAATKQAFDDLLVFYGERGLRHVTLKLFDTYGPSDSRNKLLNLLHQHSLSQVPIQMSPGEQLLDLCFIADVVDAFKLLLDACQMDELQEFSGKSFGLSGVRIQLRDLVRVFEKALNVKLNVEWGKRPYSSREVMVPWEDFERLPGWSPKTGIEEGIKETFGAYQ